MMQHIAESPERFKNILESKEKVHNLESNVTKIETRIDKHEEQDKDFRIFVQKAIGEMAEKSDKAIKEMIEKADKQFIGNAGVGIVLIILLKTLDAFIK